MHPFKAVSHQRQNKNDNRQANKRTNNRSNNRNSSSNQNQNQNAKRPQSSSQRPRTETKINYYVYGKGSAMEFFCDKTKKQSVSTISINAASKKPDDTTTTGYDWEKKTSIQLPRNEMLQIVAVMLGMQDVCEFRQNGTHSSKSYKVEFQESKVFFMVMERGKPIRAVGLSPEDTYQVASLFFKQLKENSPWMSVDEILQMIEMTIVNMGQAPARDDDDDDEEEFEQPSDIEDDSISDDDLLENEPNFNF